MSDERLHIALVTVWPGWLASDTLCSNCQVASPDGAIWRASAITTGRFQHF